MNLIYESNDLNLNSELNLLNKKSQTIYNLTRLIYQLIWQYNCKTVKVIVCVDII